MFKMKPLPFALDALQPNISKITMETHYGKHYKGYIDKTNELVGSTDRYNGLSLKQIVEDLSPEEHDPLFQQSSQAWNHEFYWDSLSPVETRPGPKTASLIQRSFGDLDKLQVHFNDKALSHFGSGWAWITSSKIGLAVTTTHDADSPLVHNVKPLLVVDLWEHAYYLDHKNDKKAYLEASWNVINWSFAERNL